MGRPSASETNKKIGLLFANAVTEDTHTKNISSFQIVDRTGRLSLFEALSSLMPSAIRDTNSHSGRSGLTRIEFNKYLEKHGFFKARSKSPYDEDQEESRGRRVQGVRYYFVYRRWLNPHDAADFKLLESRWGNLEQSLSAVDGSVTRETFVSICQTFHDQWKEELMKKSSRRSSLMETPSSKSEHDETSSSQGQKWHEASECTSSTTTDQDSDDSAEVLGPRYLSRKRTYDQMCSDCRVQHQVESVDFSLAAVDMEGGLHDNMNHYDFFPESMQLHEARGSSKGNRKSG
mmetsp:Transcript_25354/g.83877  ORF Transcript_25354/g.83877 Transcript_25354/m.83877 type:complete len:290 (-) Transcript_25354:31-900(-)